MSLSNLIYNATKTGGTKIRIGICTIADQPPAKSDITPGPRGDHIGIFDQVGSKDARNIIHANNLHLLSFMHDTQ